MENQLRHRLEAQVCEAEDLREELAVSEEHVGQAKAAVRASEERARDSADEKTKKLLSEMENLCQEKLLAENKASEMEAELELLRETVASAEKRACEEQSTFIRASEERMAGLEQV